jgi:hypothetical protein
VLEICLRTMRGRERRGEGHDHNTICFCETRTTRTRTDSTSRLRKKIPGIRREEATKTCSVTVQIHGIMLPLSLLLPKPISRGTTTTAPRKQSILPPCRNGSRLKGDTKYDYLFDDSYLASAASKKQSTAPAANEKPANVHFVGTA